jgi:hypothetical protein
VQNDCGSDTLCEIVDARCPAISLSPVQLSPETECLVGPDDQTFEVWNSSGGILGYTITDNVPWLVCTPSGGTSAGEHDTITVTYDTAGLDAGYHAATITVADPLALNSPQTVNVSLTVVPTLTVEAVPPEAGSVSGAGTYDIGEVVEVWATSNACWAFDHWEGDASGSVNPTLVTMDGCKTVQAHFVPLTYELTAQIDPPGAGWVDGTGTHDCGDTVEIEAHAHPFSSFSHWSGDASGSANPTQVSMDSNKTVTAHFVSSLSSITPIYPGNGAAIYQAPTFTWTWDAGANNVFRIVLWSAGRFYYSPTTANNSWTMDSYLWNRVPSGTYIYWAVQGADLNHEPLTIITSDEIRWFYKY